MPVAKKYIIKTVSVALVMVLVAVKFDFVCSVLKNMAVTSAVLSANPLALTDFMKTDTETETEVKNNKTEQTPKKTESEKETTAKTTSKKAVTTKSNQKVKGKITDTNLANSGANTSYKNVYFNNCTGKGIDIKQLLNTPLPYEVQKGSAPQVLIYHTHATECFMENENDYYTDSDKTRTTDKTKNMVAVGKVLANEIKNAGYSVVHDTTLHDHPSYSGSYSNSAETVNKYLKKYPSIKVVIDLHRDSITRDKGEKVAPTVTINGKKTAQVMLVMGSNTGYIDNYPKWKTNLSLAARLQQAFNTDYPGLSRALLLRSAVYNQNLSNGAFLLEVGTEANTLKEAENSAVLVGKSIVKVLKG